MSSGVRHSRKSENVASLSLPLVGSPSARKILYEPLAGQAGMTRLQPTQDIRFTGINKAENYNRLDSAFSALGKYAVYSLNGKSQITKGKDGTERTIRNCRRRRL